MNNKKNLPAYKILPAFPDYRIYSNGVIVSYRRKFPRVLALAQGNEYTHITLYNDEGEIKRTYLHRIVWEAYHGREIPANMQICHIDDNKGNNQISNLLCAAPVVNMNMGTRNKRISENMRAYWQSEQGQARKENMKNKNK